MDQEKDVGVNVGVNVLVNGMQHRALIRFFRKGPFECIKYEEHIYFRLGSMGEADIHQELLVLDKRRKIQAVEEEYSFAQPSEQKPEKTVRETVEELVRFGCSFEEILAAVQDKKAVSTKTVQDMFNEFKYKKKQAYGKTQTEGEVG